MSPTKSINADILKAVKNVNLVLAKKLLAEHGLPKDDKWNDYKILIHAVHKGNIEIVKLLLRYGCRVRSPKSHYCKTPLYYAVSSRNLEMVRVLLEAGASITDRDSNEHTPLLAAAHNQFVAAVDLMLFKYNVENIDVTNKVEMTHFFIACMRNNYKLVKSFIESGISVNMYMKNMGKRNTPLHFAVKQRFVELVEILLEHGSDYTFLNSDKCSPLHLAYYLKDSSEKNKIIDYILNSHADNAVNPVDNKGMSHFHIACTRNNKETVTNFLKNNVDVNCTTLAGVSPLCFAINCSQKEIVEILLKHGAIHSSAMHKAIKLKCQLISKLLLTYGADICAIDGSDCTPIHCAYYDLGHCHEIFNSMMSVHQGKMMNVVDKYGLSIFHMACAVGDITAVENFLIRNVDVNACMSKSSGEFSSFTGLHFAAMNYHVNVIKLLLKYNVNVNALDMNGRSAIWLAVQFVVNETIVSKLNNNLLKNKASYKAAGVSENEVMDFMYKEFRKVSVIKLLAENKSNLNHVNEEGVPLLIETYNPRLIWKVKEKIPNKNFIESICRKYNSICCKEIIEVLMKNNIGCYIPDRHCNTILHLMAEDSNCRDNLDIATVLMMNGCNANFKNAMGKTALHIAAENGSFEFAKILLKCNADPNCRDKRLSTPLHYAALNSSINEYNVETLHSKIMQLLIDNGANVDAKDTKGCTPLFYTIQRPASQRALVCLLKANCQVNICNKQGEIPLFIATNQNNASSIQLLLDYGADINLMYKKDKGGLLKQYICSFTMFQLFDSSFIDSFKIFETHIEKLRLINYPVNISDLIWRKHVAYMLVNRIFINIFIEHDFGFASFNVSEDDNFITPVLKEELKKMKMIKIGTYNVLYDMLFKNEKQMAKYVNNEDFKDYLDEETLHKEFPHYGYLLRLKYKQGMDRYVLFEPAKESLRQLIATDLPDLCFDNIFVYLSNENLKNLIDANV